MIKTKATALKHIKNGNLDRKKMVTRNFSRQGSIPYNEKELIKYAKH